MLQIARNLVGQHLLRWHKQPLTSEGAPSAGRYDKAANSPAGNHPAGNDHAAADLEDP